MLAAINLSVEDPPQGSVVVEFPKITPEEIKSHYKIIQSEGQSLYQCVYCPHMFALNTYTNKLKGHHARIAINNQRVKACTDKINPNYLLWHQRIHDEIRIDQQAVKSAEKKRKIAELEKYRSLDQMPSYAALTTQKKAQHAILEFLVDNGVAPSVTERSSFTKMVTAIQNCVTSVQRKTPSTGLLTSYVRKVYE